jgi:dTDP-4-dehydrorhamnose reductase
MPADVNLSGNHKKPLIIGGDGKLGRHLFQTIQTQGNTANATTRRQNSGSPGADDFYYFDLNDRETWVALPKASVAYICAGITSVEQCEENPTETAVVNVEQTTELAEYLSRQGCRSVLISTNRVFDGSKAHVEAASETCPTTVYGHQKAEVERRVLALPGGTVLRVSKVLFPDDNLIAGWLSGLENGEEIRAVSDMYQSPVSADLAARTMLALGENRKGGLFQLSATSDMSYLEIARYLAVSLSQNEAKVRGLSRSELPGLAATGLQPDQLSPRHTTLDCSALEKEFGIVSPTVTQTLKSVSSAEI